MILNSPTISGSLTVTGNILTSGSITLSGSVASASYAATASFVALAQSASNAVAAATASSADNLLVRNTLTAQTLVVQTITSSVDFVTGSTRFGSISENTHVFTGSMSVSGSGAFVGIVGVGGATEAGWSLKSNGNLKVENSNGTTVLQVNDTSTGGKTWSLISAGAGNAHSVAAGTFYLRNSSDSSTAFTIASTGAATFSGIVAINATSTNDDGNLSIAGAIGTGQGAANTVTQLNIWETTSGNKSGLWFGAMTNQATGVIGSRRDGGAIAFQTFSGGWAERMRISGTGNVGIGTSSPFTNYRATFTNTSVGTDRSTIYLQGIYSGTNPTAGIDFGASNGVAVAAIRQVMTNTGNGASDISFHTWDGSSLLERMRITSGGQTQFIHNTTNQDVLYIRNESASPYGMNLTFTGASPNNTTNNFIYLADSSGLKCRIVSNGSIYNATGTYGTISDIKFKENIIDATPKLDDLLKLKVRNFNLIGDETKQIGFVAQEFEEVFPNMVDNSKDKETDDEYKAIKTSVLIPVLVKAIQELKTQNDDLQQQINELKAQ
jgi:hypothetical protein